MSVRAVWMDETWHTDADADALMCSASPGAEWRKRNAGHRARQRPAFPAADWRPGTSAGVRQSSYEQET